MLPGWLWLWGCGWRWNNSGCTHFWIGIECQLNICLKLFPVEELYHEMPVVLIWNVSSHVESITCTVSHINVYTHTHKEEVLGTICLLQEMWMVLKKWEKVSKFKKIFFLGLMNYIHNNCPNLVFSPPSSLTSSPRVSWEFSAWIERQIRNIHSPAFTSASYLLLWASLFHPASEGQSIKVRVHLSKWINTVSAAGTDLFPSLPLLKEGRGFWFFLVVVLGIEPRSCACKARVLPQSRIPRLKAWFWQS